MLQVAWGWGSVLAGEEKEQRDASGTRERESQLCRWVRAQAHSKVKLAGVLVLCSSFFQN